MKEIAIKLSDFFSNAVTNFKSPKFENFDILSKNIDHSSLKAIIKSRKHSSIIAIASEFTTEGFSFNAITIEYAFKEISMLDSSKVMQATDIPVKLIKGNSNFFAGQICLYFNESIGKIKFPDF